MHRELVTEYVTATRGLDRIEIADDVGDGDVRRSELLDVPHVGLEPRDGRVVSGFLEEVLTVFGDRSERIVIYFAPGDDGERGIEECRQRAQDPRFCLTPQPEENEVVPAQERVDDLGHDRLFVADDAVEDGFAGRESSEKIRAKLILYRAEPMLRGAKGGTLQGAKCFWVDRQLILRGKSRF